MSDTRTPRVPGRAHLPLLHSCPGGVQWGTTTRGAAPIIGHPTDTGLASSLAASRWADFDPGGALR